MPSWLQWAMPFGGLLVLVLGVILVVVSLPYWIGGVMMGIAILLIFWGVAPIIGHRDYDPTGRR